MDSTFQDQLDNDPTAARLLLEAQQFECGSEDWLDRVNEARWIQLKQSWLHTCYDREFDESRQEEVRQKRLLDEIERRKQDEIEAVANMEREEAQLRQQLQVNKVDEGKDAQKAGGAGEGRA